MGGLLVAGGKAPPSTSLRKGGVGVGVEVGASVAVGEGVGAAVLVGKLVGEGVSVGEAVGGSVAVLVGVGITSANIVAVKGDVAVGQPVAVADGVEVATSVGGKGAAAVSGIVRVGLAPPASPGVSKGLAVPSGCRLPESSAGVSGGVRVSVDAPGREPASAGVVAAVVISAGRDVSVPSISWRSDPWGAAAWAAVYSTIEPQSSMAPSLKASNKGRGNDQARLSIRNTGTPPGWQIRAITSRTKLKIA